MIALPQLPSRLNEAARDLTGRTYLSHSQVHGFRSCPRKWAFHYVEDAPPAFTPLALVFGSAFHAALQAHFEGKLAGRPLKTPQVLDTFNAHLIAQADAPIKYGKNDTPESVRELGERMVRSFLDSPLAHPRGDIVFVEEELRASVAPNLPDLVAKVDLGLIVDGRLKVVDFKTSRSRWREDAVGEHADQLLLYRLLALRLNPHEEVDLAFHVVTKAVTPVVQDLPVAYDPTTAAQVVESMRPVWKAMQAGAYFPAPSVMHCTTCPFQSRCPAYRGGDPEPG